MRSSSAGLAISSHSLELADDAYNCFACHFECPLFRLKLMASSLEYCNTAGIGNWPPIINQVLCVMTEV